MLSSLFLFCSFGIAAEATTFMDNSFDVCDDEGVADKNGVVSVMLKGVIEDTTTDAVEVANGRVKFEIEAATSTKIVSLIMNDGVAMVIVERSVIKNPVDWIADAVMNGCIIEEGEIVLGSTCVIDAISLLDIV